MIRREKVGLKRILCYGSIYTIYMCRASYTILQLSLFQISNGLFKKWKVVLIY
ncbi:hypothetical protein Hanom_Chr13g01207231 [Helianthus anomalus]